MKIKEAIENLKYLISGDCTDNQMDFVEEIEMGIQALEKQTPKKATRETINRGIDISGEYDIDFNLCCPICGAIIGTFEEEDEYYFKYCPTCGQHLDWSDTEKGGAEE